MREGAQTGKIVVSVSEDGVKLSVLARLSLVNAVGFSASTVMPLWLTGVAQRFHQPPWFAGAAVVAQIGGAAGFNLLTPLLFRALEAASRWPAPPWRFAAAAYLLAAAGRGGLFLPACLGCGAALGVVLNVTNRLMGSAEHAQRGYALFVLIEVLFATLLFLGVGGGDGALRAPGRLPGGERGGAPGAPGPGEPPAGGGTRPHGWGRPARPRGGARRSWGSSPSRSSSRGRRR